MFSGCNLNFQVPKGLGISLKWSWEPRLLLHRKKHRTRPRTCRLCSQIGWQTVSLLAFQTLFTSLYSQYPVVSPSLTALLGSNLPTCMSSLALWLQVKDFGVCQICVLDLILPLSPVVSAKSLNLPTPVK